MFESNFPVDKGMCSYSNLWNAFKRIAENYSNDEKNAMFHNTALKFYRLVVIGRQRRPGARLGPTPRPQRGLAGPRPPR